MPGKQVSDCIVASQQPGTHGYPMTSRGRGRYTLVHRLVWEDTHGPIPEGMEIHHVCDNKVCVNPEHLVTISRADHNWITHGKTHCVRGHDLAVTRRRTTTGRTYCSACNRENQQRRRDAS